jgi:tetratricopeptide (TPR) repeat protein
MVANKKHTRYLVGSILFFVMGHCYINAQQKKIDSLYQTISKAKNDTSVIKCHIRLNVIFRKNLIYDSAFSHIILANRLAEEINSEKFLAKTFYLLSNTYSEINEYDSCIFYHKKSLKYISDKTSTSYYDALMRIGNAYYIKGDYLNAYDYFFKYLQQAIIYKDRVRQAKGYSNVGIILKEQRKYNEALVNFNRTLKIGEQIKDTTLLYVAHSNIGTIYTDKGHNEDKAYFTRLALYNYQKATKYCSQLKNFDMVNKMVLHANLANAYADIDDYNRALFEYEEVTKMIENEPYFPQSALIYNNFTAFYLKYNNISMAEKYIKIAQALSIKSNAPDNLAENYQNFAQLYSLKGNFQSAFEAHKMYKLYNDSLFNAQNTERLKEIQLNSEFELKESINLAKHEKKEAIAKQQNLKQQLIITLVLVVVLFLIIFSFFLFNRFRVTKKQKLIIEKQKILVDNAYTKLHEKNKEVLDSIRYAKRIQDSLLPTEKYIHKFLRNKLYS